MTSTQRVAAYATTELGWTITAETWAGVPIADLSGFTPKFCFTLDGELPPIDRGDTAWLAGSWLSPKVAGIKIGTGAVALDRGSYSAHLVLISAAISPGWCLGVVEVY
jgi:hypothetical protein